MTPSQASWVRRSELLILVVGIGLRLARYLQKRPLWLDEAMLSLNFLSRPPLTFQPLNDNQVSPLGFLWLEWLVAQLAGTGEQALRFIPLVAAIVALFAFSRLARRTLEPGMALLATALAALSPLLVYYSAEVKSYGFDWLCAILMMHATLTLMETSSRDAWVRWGLAAAFSALMSTSAPFYVAGCAIALLVSPEMRRDSRMLLRVAGAGTPAALIFVFHLATVYASTSITSFMQVFWTESFLELSGPGLKNAVRLIREFWSESLLSGDALASLPRKTMTIIVGISAIGAFAIARRSLPTAVFLVGPALFAGIASLAKYWPLTPRLLLFLVPTVLLTLPAGLAWIARLAPRNARTPLLAMLSVVVMAAALYGVRDVLRWQNRFVDVPGVLREVGAHATENATVYVSAELIPACVYYVEWHPDRPAWAVDPLRQECVIAGRRTVLGTYPDFIGLAHGAEPSGPRMVEPEWVEREASGVVSQPSPETWLLIASGFVKDALPPWFAKSGMALVRDTTMGRIGVMVYRSP